jgi:hypothetical protein
VYTVSVMISTVLSVSVVTGYELHVWGLISGRDTDSVFATMSRAVSEPTSGYWG